MKTDTVLCAGKDLIQKNEKKPHICGNLQMEYKVRKYPGQYDFPFSILEMEDKVKKYPSNY